MENQEVTLFLTSCNRPNLLKVTLVSFLKYNTFPIKEAIIMEDSGLKGINDFALKLLPFPCKIIYTEKRMGQMKSIENGAKFINTPYVFHCEEDWEFYDSGFIEKSLEILESNNKISVVKLRSYNEYLNRYKMTIENTINPLYNIIHQNNISMYTFNPSLRKKEISLFGMPYDNNQDEGTIQKLLNAFGYISVVTKNPNGYIRHIGWNDHVH